MVPLQLYPSPNTQAQFLHNAKQMGVLYFSSTSKITNLITDEYANNNHRVSTLSDAAQHMAGKNFSSNWAAPRLTTASKWQIINPSKCLPSIFASRTFACRRLAQGLSRSLSAFSSFMRDYLDKAIKADQCAQYVDDIGIAANDTKQLCTNIRTVFECIRNRIETLHVEGPLRS